MYLVEGGWVYLVQGGVPAPDQVHPPGPGAPLGTGTPPWTRYSPLGPGTPPRTRYTPQTRYTPGTRYIPQNFFFFKIFFFNIFFKFPLIQIFLIQIFLNSNFLIQIFLNSNFSFFNLFFLKNLFNSPPPPPPPWTVNVWAVRILLECILVFNNHIVPFACLQNFHKILSF